MKLLLFFALIGISLCSSLIILQLAKNMSYALIKATLLNLIILGLGSWWWFATETDGISQGIGGMIYFGSFVGIFLIDVVVIFVRKSFVRN
jgi:hypothetical protein